MDRIRRVQQVRALLAALTPKLQECEPFKAQEVGWGSSCRAVTSARCLMRCNFHLS